MENNINRKTFASAGALYLNLIITGIFAHLVVRAMLIVPGNASATASNILESEFWFRLGLFSDLAHMVSFILLALIFYKIFKNVNLQWAITLLAIVLVTNAIMGLNLLNQMAALHILTKPALVNAFEPVQREAGALFFLQLHSTGIHIGYIFFGLWLLPLSRLVKKAHFFPGKLGNLVSILLLMGGIGYLLDFTVYVLFPEFYSHIARYATLPADIGEMLLCLWLLIKGARGNVKDHVAFAAVNQPV